MCGATTTRGAHQAQLSHSGFRFRPRLPLQHLAIVWTKGPLVLLHKAQPQSQRSDLSFIFSIKKRHCGSHIVQNPDSAHGHSCDLAAFVLQTFVSWWPLARLLRSTFAGTWETLESDPLGCKVTRNKREDVIGYLIDVHKASRSSTRRWWNSTPGHSADISLAQSTCLMGASRAALGLVNVGAWLKTCLDPDLFKG